MKTQIFRFRLENFNFQMIEFIVSAGYNKTGNKFSVSLNGSKGYLSNIVISCEGQRSNDNVFFIEKYINRDGSFNKNTVIDIFHCPENGVSIEVSKQINPCNRKPKC